MEDGMNSNNLFFHIHYCNYRQFGGAERALRKITRTLPHHELLFIKGGKGSITIGKKRYQLKGCMLFYICPDVHHSFEIDADEPGYFLSVHFSYVRVSFNDSKWDVKNEGDGLSLSPGQELKDYYHIEDAFRKLAESWETKLPGYEFATRTLLQQLLITVFQHTRKQNQNYAISLKVEKVIEYMHQHASHRVNLAELSELVHLAPTYLSRSFKETTGYSVIEFFNRIKIDKAKELMIEGDKKVKEVAQALGFTDEFYFSRIFKRIEGMSPSEYCSKNVHGV